MNAYRGHFQFAAQGTPIKLLDVLQLVVKLQIAGVELVVGQGVEHERVVGIGAVTDAYRLGHCAHRLP